MYKPVYPGLYYFDTFTFTSLGTAGHRGPESDKGYTNAPWRDGEFSIQDGVQHWTVPTTGTYSITAAGAYGTQPGRVVSGTVPLYESQTLEMLVGQQPTPLVANVADNVTVGGGGGTFVTTDGKPLMVASGGDGTGGSAGSFSPYGDGNGKNGGGYLSNGLATNATFKFLRPAAYVDGGFGATYPTGVVSEEGGFGGGQAPVTTGISGGGGYTGSAGDGVSGATCYADSTVENFTDLGPSSNSSGYVTVRLTDPVPLKRNFNGLSSVDIYAAVNGNVYWSDIAYSSQLKTYVACSDFYNGQGVVYSRDGKVWKRSDFTGLDTKSIEWSPELSLFTTVEYHSTDGITWIQNGGLGFGRIGQILWVPFLHVFLAHYDYGQLIQSSDALQWTSIGTSPYFGTEHKTMATSSSAVIAVTGTDVYISYTGSDWNIVLVLDEPVNVVSYGNGTFIIFTFLYYYTSVDGVTWSSAQNSPIPRYYTGTVVSACVFTDTNVVLTLPGEYGINPDGRVAISNDFVHWDVYVNHFTDYDYIHTYNYYQAMVYNPDDDVIVAVSWYDINLSIDGSVWTTATRTFVSESWDSLSYSPETNTFVLTSSNGQTSSTTGVYSTDGIIWKQIPDLSFYPTSNKWYPLNEVFTLDNFIFNPRGGSGIATDAWLQTTNTELLRSYYETGENNNNQYAFTISGIVVPIPEDQYNGYRISCSGTTFVRLTRYGSTVDTSTDGINWTTYNISGVSTNDLRGVIYISKYNSFFAITGDNGNACVIQSYDGINWFNFYTLGSIIPIFRGMVWASSMNKLVIVTYSSCVVHLTLDESF